MSQSPKGEWRTKPPSDKQLNMLKFKGYKGEMPKTAGDASDLISGQIQKTDAGIQRVNLSLTAEQLDSVAKEVKREVHSKVAVLNFVEEYCRELGVTNGATIGMIFNQIYEDRRNSLLSDTK